jgi:hypothetical protein
LLHKEPHRVGHFIPLAPADLADFANNFREGFISEKLEVCDLETLQLPSFIFAPKPRTGSVYAHDGAEEILGYTASNIWRGMKMRMDSVRVAKVHRDRVIRATNPNDLSVKCTVLLEWTKHNGFGTFATGKRNNDAVLLAEQKSGGTIASKHRVNVAVRFQCVLWAEARWQASHPINHRDGRVIVNPCDHHGRAAFNICEVTLLD